MTDQQEGATLEVVDNAAELRFEARDGDRVVGFAQYQVQDQTVVFTHTEVDDDEEGQGVGGALVRGALDQVRDAGLTVLPVCPFVKAWIDRHEDYQPLVVENTAL